MNYGNSGKPKIEKQENFQKNLNLKNFEEENNKKSQVRNSSKQYIIEETPGGETISSYQKKSKYMNQPEEKPMMINGITPMGKFGPEPPLNAETQQGMQNKGMYPPNPENTYYPSFPGNMNEYFNDQESSFIGGTSNGNGENIYGGTVPNYQKHKMESIEEKELVDYRRHQIIGKLKQQNMKIIFECYSFIFFKDQKDVHYCFFYHQKSDGSWDYEFGNDNEKLTIKKDDIQNKKIETAEDLTNITSDLFTEEYSIKTSNYSVKFSRLKNAQGEDQYYFHFDNVTGPGDEFYKVFGKSFKEYYTNNNKKGKFKWIDDLDQYKNYNLVVLNSTKKQLQTYRIGFYKVDSVNFMVCQRLDEEYIRFPELIYVPFKNPSKNEMCEFQKEPTIKENSTYYFENNYTKKDLYEQLYVLGFTSNDEEFRRNLYQRFWDNDNNNNTEMHFIRAIVSHYNLSQQLPEGYLNTKETLYDGICLSLYGFGIGDLKNYFKNEKNGIVKKENLFIPKIKNVNLDNMSIEDAMEKSDNDFLFNQEPKNHNFTNVLNNQGASKDISTLYFENFYLLVDRKDIEKAQAYIFRNQNNKNKKERFKYFQEHVWEADKTCVIRSYLKEYVGKKTKKFNRRDPYFIIHSQSPQYKKDLDKNTEYLAIPIKMGIVYIKEKKEFAKIYYVQIFDQQYIFDYKFELQNSDDKYDMIYDKKLDFYELNNIYIPVTYNNLKSGKDREGFDQYAINNMDKDFKIFILLNKPLIKNRDVETRLCSLELKAEDVLNTVNDQGYYEEIKQLKVEEKENDGEYFIYFDGQDLIEFCDEGYENLKNGILKLSEKQKENYEDHFKQIQENINITRAREEAIDEMEKQNCSVVLECTNFILFRDENDDYILFKLDHYGNHHKPFYRAIHQGDPEKIKERDMNKDMNYPDYQGGNYSLKDSSFDKEIIIKFDNDVDGHKQSLSLKLSYNKEKKSYLYKVNIEEGSFVGIFGLGPNEYFNTQKAKNNIIWLDDLDKTDDCAIALKQLLDKNGNIIYDKNALKIGVCKMGECLFYVCKEDRDDAEIMFMFDIYFRDGILKTDIFDSDGNLHEGQEISCCIRDLYNFEVQNYDDKHPISENDINQLELFIENAFDRTFELGKYKIKVNDLKNAVRNNFVTGANVVQMSSETTPSGPNFYDQRYIVGKILNKLIFYRDRKSNVDVKPDIVDLDESYNDFQQYRFSLINNKDVKYQIKNNNPINITNKSSLKEDILMKLKNLYNKNNINDNISNQSDDQINDENKIYKEFNDIITCCYMSEDGENIKDFYIIANTEQNELEAWQILTNEHGKKTVKFYGGDEATTILQNCDQNCQNGMAFLLEERYMIENGKVIRKRILTTDNYYFVLDDLFNVEKKLDVNNQSDQITEIEDNLFDLEKIYMTVKFKSNDHGTIVPYFFMPIYCFSSHYNKNYMVYGYLESKSSKNCVYKLIDFYEISKNINTGKKASEESDLVGLLNLESLIDCENESQFRAAMEKILEKEFYTLEKSYKIDANKNLIMNYDGIEEFFSFFEGNEKLEFSCNETIIKPKNNEKKQQLEKFNCEINSPTNGRYLYELLSNASDKFKMVKGYYLDNDISDFKNLKGYYQLKNINTDKNFQEKDFSNFNENKSLIINLKTQQLIKEQCQIIYSCDDFILYRTVYNEHKCIFLEQTENGYEYKDTNKNNRFYELQYDEETLLSLTAKILMIETSKYSLKIEYNIENSNISYRLVNYENKDKNSSQFYIMGNYDEHDIAQNTTWLNRNGYFRKIRITRWAEM